MHTPLDYSILQETRGIAILSKTGSKYYTPKVFSVEYSFAMTMIALHISVHYACVPQLLFFIDNQMPHMQV